MNRSTRHAILRLVLCGVLSLCFRAGPSLAAAPPEQVTRPLDAGGTVVVPDHFLRRWDPLTVFFDKSRGPGGPAPEDDPGRLVSLAPDHPGAWRWIDPLTLQFRPAEPWPPLTRFTAKVDGAPSVLATLMEPPVQTSPPHGASGLDPVESIQLAFTDPLDVQALARMLTIELRVLPGAEAKGARILTGDDFTIKALERKSRTDRALYSVGLKSPIPYGMRALLRFRLALEDGGDQSFAEVSFATAEPFRLVAAGTVQTRYPLAPEGTRYPKDQAIRGDGQTRALAIQFSSPPGALGPLESRNLVRLTPAVENLSFSQQGPLLLATGNFAWDTVYRMDLVPIRLADAKGRALEMKGESGMWLFFPRPGSYLRWGAGQGTVERFGPQMIPLEGRGFDRLDLRVYKVDPFNRSFWPFPDQAVTVDESLRPPGPGEEPPPFTDMGRNVSPQEIAGQITLLGSPPVSTLVKLPTQREGSAASFGLDLSPHLAALGGKDQPGHYLVGMRRLDQGSVRNWVRVQVTDLCLTAVEEPRAVRFSVTSLASGAPVAGARVRVEGFRTLGNRPGWETMAAQETDREGTFLWQVDYERLKGFYVRRIVVEKERDVLVLDPARPPVGYADNIWNPGRENWLQWVTGATEGRGEQPRVLIHLFTDRPVYKPEEEVHLKGYIRKRDRGRLAAFPVTGNLVVNGPGNMTWRYPVSTDPAGGFYHKFSEAKLPTGVYTAHLEGKDGAVYGQVSFRMESYKLPLFEVRLNGPERVALDKEFTVGLTAAYYAGGRAAGRPVQWRVTQFPYPWTPGKREGFFFSSDSRFSRLERFDSSPRLERQDTTDEQGASSLTLDPAVEPTAQPRSYVVEATVTGADDQTVTATRSVIALPPFVLGLKVPRYIEKALTIDPRIIAVGPDGELLPDLSVTVRLLKRQWHSVLRAGDFSEGVARYQTDVVDEKVLETTAKTAGEAVGVSLPIKESGVYVVELEARDRLDRAQVVAVDLYAGGDQAMTWPKPVAGVFTVSPDKPAYDPGDTASLVLASPFQNGRALAIIEGPDGNQYSWLDVRNGAAVFSLPIAETFAPAVPVHFILMRGRVAGTSPLPGTTTDLGKPATVAATAWLSVNPVGNRVETKLEYPAKATPGQEIEVRVTLQDPGGNPLPGEVTLWLVDQAVLALGTEQRLDPLPDFLARVRSHLVTRDTRNLVFGFLPFAEKPGGDGMAERMAKGAMGLLDRTTIRRLFQSVPYFNPSIMVGPDGSATVKVKLPDNLTNFKLRAKAVSGANRFGFAVGQIEVRLPVIVQPALPRFVRPGDSFSAAVIGRVVEGEGGPGSAEMRVQGVRLLSPGKAELAWAPNRPQRLDFPVEVPQPPLDKQGRPSVREVVFQAAVERSSDQARDAFEVRIPLRDDRDRVVLRQLAELVPGKPFAIPDLPEPARPGSVMRSVLVSDQPGLVRMAGGLSFLLEYPYGCTEQRISRARVQLALGRFRTLLHQTDSQEELDRVVRETLDFISATVDPNGLVAYWPGARGYVSLTAWVTQFVVEARAAGYPVDERLFNDLIRVLQQALRSDYSRFIDGESFAERCMALAALASAGLYDPAYAAELARRSQFLDLEGVAQVLMALSRAGDTSPVIRDLSKKLWEGVIVRLYQGREVYGGLQETRASRNGLILPSETRTLAELTRSIVRSGVEAPRREILVNALVTLGKGDGWGTTNANASALLALSEFLQPPFAGAAPRRFSVRFGDESGEIATGPEAPLGFYAAASGGAGEVVLREGPGEGVVVRAETAFIPLADGGQVQPAAAGFVVSREHARVKGDGNPSERTRLEKGGLEFAYSVADVVEEHVQVVNPSDRHFVAVIVPLAAGMEPLNPNLATSPPEARPSGRLTLEPTYSAYMDDHVGFYFDSLPKGTYDFFFRVRATTPGSFTQPAAKAEMMYDGAVRGNSAGARVVIARPEN